jgi:phosphoglycolate phosphatase-like HAD superfamily hydrolase/membrane protease YdiL (CAAX protease family)
MWDTVFFDLDGTITDSGEGITKSVQYALKKGFEIDADPDDLRCFVGPPLLEQFMSYASLTKEQAELAVKLYRERYESIGIYENRLYDGIRTVLHQLKNEHFRIALSSSKPRVYCEQILKYFNVYQYFDVVEGAEMDGRRTDKAEVVHEVIHRLHMEDQKDRIVLVGDRNYDIIGARHEGISSIGVTYGYGSREELEAVWPDCIVDTPEELRNVLIGQKRDGDRRSSYQVRRKYPYDGGTAFQIWKVIWPALLAYGINIALAVVFEAVLGIVGGMFSPSELQHITEKYSMPLTGIMDAILLAVMARIWHRDELQRRAWNAQDRLLKKNRFGVIQGIMCACFVLTVEFLLSIFSWIIPSSEEYSEFVSSFGSFPAWVTFLLIGVLGPLAEEFLFRGVIFRRLRDFTNVWVAAALSGITFGVFHGNLEQGIPAAVIGMAMALLYEHYGTILASIVGHMGVNCYALVQELVSGKKGSASVAETITVLILVAGVLSFYEIFFRERKMNRI